MRGCEYYPEAVIGWDAADLGIATVMSRRGVGGMGAG